MIVMTDSPNVSSNGPIYCGKWSQRLLLQQLQSQRELEKLAVL